MTKTASGNDISGLGYAAFLTFSGHMAKYPSSVVYICINGSAVTDRQKLDFQAAGPRHPQSTPRRALPDDKYRYGGWSRSEGLY